MIVLSKKQAQSKSIESLFENNGTFTLHDKRVFCTGRYQKTIIGREVVNIDGVRLVYAEKHGSNDSGYYKLYCIYN